MVQSRSFQGWAVALGLTVFVGAVIGCGGGGGGGSTTGTNTNTNGTNTNGTNTNGTNTNGTNTNGTNTNGTNTNGTNTNGTNTNTTNTNGTNGTTTTTTGSGVLPTNVIFYADDVGASIPQNFNVMSVTPAGGTAHPYLSNVSNTIDFFAFNSNVTNGYVFAATTNVNASSPTYGIYSNTGLTMTGAKQIVAPAYEQVLSISLSPDGTKIVYTAVDGNGQGNLYSVPAAGGTATLLDLSDGSALSPADGNTIAYTKSTGAVDQLFTRLLSAGSNGTATQVTNDSYNYYPPAISRDGTLLATTKENQSGTIVDQLSILKLSTQAQVLIPNSNGVFPTNPAFSSDGTSVGFIVLASASSATGIYTAPTSGSTNPTLIENDLAIDPSYSLYWSSSTGRGIGSSSVSSAGAVKRLRNMFRKRSSGTQIASTPMRIVRHK